MSIIERAAELLGSSRQKRQDVPAEGEDAKSPDGDLIERAARNYGLARGGSVDGRIAEAPLGRHRVAPAGGAPSRALAIDRERLRRQSMIVPGSVRTAIAEDFRRIKRQVLTRVAGPETGKAPANLVAVTSALPGEGKTFCAINRALSIALEVDRTVLLVDADVAKPDVPNALGLKADKGLMDLLLDRGMRLQDVLWKTDVGKLALLPAGTKHEHATELLASDAMNELLQELAGRYHDRIVIFDSPPLLAASEAGVLAGQVGQIILVVEAAKTSESALKDALARVDSSKVTGLLLNKGQSHNLEYGYGSYG